MKQRAKKKLWKQSLGFGLSMAMALSMLPAVPAKAEETGLLKAGSLNVTDTSVTSGQPFAAGTAGSDNFRIPALIVTQDGNLLAAADARYQTTGDGGGLDTIASLSEDGGETWKYSFPLFFPDSNGYAGPAATTIIDPVLVQGEDGAVYCMADVNPTGVTTMGGYTSPNVGTGYITVDGKERLALTSNYDNVNTRPTEEDTEKYEYYVGDWNEDGYAAVVSREDGSASGYAVDKWYNLYSVKGGEYVADLTQAQVNDAETQIQQNAFYKDSVLHVYNTGYIMYAKSTDDGFTWGDPEIINPQIKREDETGLLVSPGKGLLVSDGTIVIPFYEHGDGEENASIIWSDDNGATWTRSDDVPGTADGGYWSSESEVVELKDGTLRMFFRSGQGAVCYADAVRNGSGAYEFTAPRSTGVSCTSTCNVTASIYSKEIDGKTAILVGMPGGSGRANGKVFTFLVDENDGNSMSLKNTFAVPESANAYQYSCMAELPDASVGLLWENGAASMRYDNFNIMELAPNGYIPGAEMDITLHAGATYQREYTAEVAEIQQQPDPLVATAEVVRKGAEEKTIVPLYPHIANNSGSLSSFSETADTSLDIANAEWTVTETEGENAFSVYSEWANKYLVNVKNDNGTIVLSDTPGNGIVFKQEVSDTFRLQTGGDTRYLIFFLNQMNFNAMSDYNSDASQYVYDLTLLEKQDVVGEDDPIPGYRIASEVTSGKKYLITYRSQAEDTSYTIIFYPSNGDFNAQTKLAGEAFTEVGSALSQLTITGVGEGQTKAVIDQMTYNITCLGNKKINLRKGQKYFIEGAVEGVSNDPAAVKVESGEESRNALFDCERAGQYNFDGYSDVPNWDIDMTEAEFIVDTAEGSEDAYTIYNPSADVYLTNSNAQNYFESTIVPQRLNQVDSGDGVTSFEIIRADSGRFCYFFYEKMAFDALGGINEGNRPSWEEKGDFGFEFLEKSDTITNLDPIPGYRLASEIKPGETYLITEYYTVKEEGEEDIDGIIVLYPRIGIENQSKLYKTVDIPGVYVTALADSGTVQVTVDGEVYDVVIEGACAHDGPKRINGKVDPTCTEDGYSGDTYCSDCGELIRQGETVEAIGHRYDDGKVTTPVTTTTDGVMTFTCLNDSSHTYTEAISSYDFVKAELSKAVEAAKVKAAQTDVYTEQTIAKLNQAISEAEGLAGDASQDAYNAALTKVLEAEDALVTIELQTNIDELTRLVTSPLEKDEYEPESYAVYQNAIENGRNLLDKDNYTVRTLQNAIRRIQNAIESLVSLKDLALADVNEKLDQKLAEAQKLLPNQSAYSVETYAEFKNAYDNAAAVRNSEKVQSEKDVAALSAALTRLSTAMSGLKAPAPKPPTPVETKVDAPSIKKVSVSAAKNGIHAVITVNAVTGADKYAVYRIANGKTELVGTTASGKASVTDKKLASKKVSYYAVALDANGKEISDKGGAKALSLESATKIKKVSSKSSGIKITWKKGKKATSYIVYRSNKKNGTYTKVGTAGKSKSSYTDKKAAKGKTYYYKVVVKTKKGFSLMSSASKKVKRKK